MKIKLIILVILVILSVINAQTDNIDDLKTRLLNGATTIEKYGTPGILRVFGKNSVSLMIDEANYDAIGAALYYNGNQGRVCAFSQNGYLYKQNFPVLLNCARWMAEKKGLKTFMTNNSSNNSIFVSIGFTPVNGNIFDPKISIDNVGFIVIDINRMQRIKSGDAIYNKLVNYLINGGGLILGVTSWAYGQESEMPGNVLLIDQGIFFSNNYFYTDIPKVNNAVKEKTNNYYIANELLKEIQNIKNLGDLFFNFSNQIRNLVLEMRVLFTAMKYNGNYDSFSSTDLELFPILNNIYKQGCNGVNVVPKILNDKLSKACVYLVMTINYFQGLAKDNNPQILAGEFFPGKSKDGSTWKTLGKKSFNLTVDAKRNRWYSTGLYALPGATVKFSVTSQISLDKVSVRIGCHSDNISSHDVWTRYPMISTVYPFLTNDIQFTTYDGGLIYFNIKDAPFNFNVVISGEVVQAPYFNIEKTSLSDWNGLIRNYPAPWAEIEGDHFISSIQSDFVRKLDSPDSVAKFYGSTMMNSYHDFNSVSPRTYKERWVCDIDISAGYMHSGYPIMSFLDQNEAMITVPAPAYEEKPYPIKNALWGEYHEMGHNFQVGHWTFSGEGEVTNNWMSAYHEEYYPGRCNTMWCHIELKPSGEYYKKFVNYQKSPNFDLWKSDPWLALSMWLELRLAFGWQAFKDLIRQYTVAAKSELPQNDDEKRDQKMVRFSKIVNRNLAPFFTRWGVPTSQQAKDSINSLPSWDNNYIVDCSKRWGNNAPCAQMTISNKVVGQSSTYTFILNTWAVISFKKQESLMIIFKGDVPTHVNGLQVDSSFPLTLDQNTAQYIKPTATYNASKNSLVINVVKYLPSETNLSISFTMKNSLTKTSGFVTAGIKTVDSSLIENIYIERELEVNTSLNSSIKTAYSLTFLEDEE